jgi:stearoyl-CoA desaturase (delta-9 desaturase)
MASSSSEVPVAQAETFPDGTTDHVPLRKRTYDIRKPRELPVASTWR